jgi:hypothetical protein
VLGVAYILPSIAQLFSLRQAFDVPLALAYAHDMNTEFFSLTFSRQDLREVYEAMVVRAELEDELRRERGLEPVASRPMLTRIEGMLALSERQVEQVADVVDEGLWEHAWYTFTDEWAWFRARQDVEKEIGATITLPEEKMRGRIEEKYQADFERYVAEIDMKDVKERKIV